jgi:hypothetical protein
MQCFASATASSFSGAMVERVDRDMMGRSAWNFLAFSLGPLSIQALNSLPAART